MQVVSEVALIPRLRAGTGFETKYVDLSSRPSDPLPPQQPHLDQLRQDNVAQQRESQQRTVRRWKRSEPEVASHWDERHGDTDCPGAWTGSHY